MFKLTSSRNNAYEYMYIQMNLNLKISKQHDTLLVIQISIFTHKGRQMYDKTSMVFCVTIVCNILFPLTCMLNFVIFCLISAVQQWHILCLCICHQNSMPSTAFIVFLDGCRINSTIRRVRAKTAIFTLKWSSRTFTPENVQLISVGFKTAN